MKKIVVAVLLSFVGPGLGQIYNRDYKKGTIILAATLLIFLIYLALLYVKVVPLLPDPRTQIITPELVKNAVLSIKEKDRHLLSLAFFAFLGLWAYAISESYFKAKEIHEKEQSPNEQDTV